jgi:hypothetical protein
MKARLVLGSVFLSLAAFLAGWSASSHYAAVPAEAPAVDPNLERVLQRLEDLEAQLEQGDRETRNTFDWTEALEALGPGWWNVIYQVQDCLGLQIFNVYASDPNARMRELTGNSEDVRRIEQEWGPIWFTDQPGHMTPERVHGGIQ